MLFRSVEKIVVQAIETERKACENVCKDAFQQDYNYSSMQYGALYCADAIRKRPNTGEEK